MIIETILIVLGILTAVLGIWNIFVGAYVWGSLFILGGIWSIALGTIYILQLKKERERVKAGPTNTIIQLTPDTLPPNEDLTETDNAEIFPIDGPVFEDGTSSTTFIEVVEPDKPVTIDTSIDLEDSVYDFSAIETEEIQIDETLPEEVEEEVETEIEEPEETEQETDENQ